MDGWKPLCDFLEKKKPEEAYPEVRYKNRDMNQPDASMQRDVETSRLLIDSKVWKNTMPSELTDVKALGGGLGSQEAKMQERSEWEVRTRKINIMMRDFNPGFLYEELCCCSPVSCTYECLTRFI